MTTQQGITKSLKKMYVLAIREGLKSINLQSIDPVIKKLKASAEYPIERVQYPSLWITTSVGSLSWISMNSQLETPGGFPYNRGAFDATIHVEAIALTAEERDAAVDAVINMVMFGHLEDDANLFYKYLVEEPFIDLAPLNSEVKLSSESITFGTPWDERQIAYARSVSFPTYGEFVQRLDTGQLVDLRKIDIGVV